MGRDHLCLWRGQTPRRKGHAGWEGFGQAESGGRGFQAKETAEAKLRGLQWHGAKVRWGQAGLVGGGGGKVGAEAGDGALAK